MMVKKHRHSRLFLNCCGVAVILLLAGIALIQPRTAAAATVYLNDGSELTENSPPPARKNPVLFVHGHDPSPDPNNPNYQKNWWHSLGNLPSFKQTLELAENGCLGIEPYYIYFQDQGRSIALDAADIGDAIDSILARHQVQDPNNPDLKVVIIAYSKGTLSSRLYIKNVLDNNFDIPVSAFIAIAPPNHGLNVWPLLNASLAARQLNNGYGGLTCSSLGEDAKDFIEALNGHPIEDTLADNFDPTIEYPSEAPGSRPPGSPPQDGVLYVTLYASGNSDFVGGSAPSDDCQGRVLAKNLAADAVNIDFLEVPGNGPVSVHQNTVHWPQTIFTALYTAVYQQVPPDNAIVGVTGSNPPLIPAPAAQPPDASVVLLFDRSGSMNWGHDGSYNVAEPARRITLAKQAAIPFVWMLNYFNPCGANFAIAVFPHQPQQACEGQVISDLARVQESTIATAIETTIPGLTPGGSTPLLAGIDTAANLFANDGPKALILLSDGFQNCPSMVGAEAAQIAQRVQELNGDGINVHAIGFGQPAEVPHDLLNEIGTGTGGGFYDVTADPNFNPGAWDPGNALQERYKAALVDTLQLESAADPMAVINSGETHVHDFQISKSDQKVIVYLSWVAFQHNRLLLTVTSSDGHEVSLSDPPAGVQLMGGDTFKIIAFESLFLKQPGKVGPNPWQIKISLVDT
ncbi:MAG: VWA domain-containing protein, partial [Desulfobacterales bacterium]